MTMSLSMSSKDNSWYKCQICNLSFTNLQHFSIHLSGILHDELLKKKLLLKENESQKASEEELPSRLNLDSDHSARNFLMSNSLDSLPSSSYDSCHRLPKSSKQTVSCNATVVSPGHHYYSNTRTSTSSCSSLMQCNYSHSTKESHQAQTKESQRSKAQSSGNCDSGGYNCSDLQRNLQEEVPITEDGIKTLKEGSSKKKGKINIKTLLAAQLSLMRSTICNNIDKSVDDAPKVETKGKDPVKSLLAAQFDLLKSYMTEPQQVSSGVEPRNGETVSRDEMLRSKSRQLPLTDESSEIYDREMRHTKPTVEVRDMWKEPFSSSGYADILRLTEIEKQPYVLRQHPISKLEKYNSAEHNRRSVQPKLNNDQPESCVGVSSLNSDFIAAVKENILHSLFVHSSPTSSEDYTRKCSYSNTSALSGSSERYLSSASSLVMSPPLSSSLRQKVLTMIPPLAESVKPVSTTNACRQKTLPTPSSIHQLPLPLSSSMPGIYSGPSCSSMEVESTFKSKTGLYVEKANSKNAKNGKEHIINFAPVLQRRKYSESAARSEVKSRTEVGVGVNEPLGAGVDLQLKLKQQIESVMVNRVDELRKAIPEVMMRSIMAGKVPLEFLDKISDFIPVEILEDAVKYLEVSKAKTTESVESGNEIWDKGQHKNQLSDDIRENQTKEKATKQLQESPFMKLELVKRAIEEILGSMANETNGAQNTGLLEQLVPSDRVLALELQGVTGIKDVSVIVDIMNFFKTLHPDLLVSLSRMDNSNSNERDGKGSVLQQVAKFLLSRCSELSRSRETIRKALQFKDNTVKEIQTSASNEKSQAGAKENTNSRNSLRSHLNNLSSYNAANPNLGIIKSEVNISKKVKAFSLLPQLPQNSTAEELQTKGPCVISEKDTSILQNSDAESSSGMICAGTMPHTASSIDRALTKDNSAAAAPTIRGIISSQNKIQSNKFRNITEKPLVTSVLFPLQNKTVVEDVVVEKVDAHQGRANSKNTEIRGSAAIVKDKSGVHQNIIVEKSAMFLSSSKPTTAIASREPVINVISVQQINTSVGIRPETEVASLLKSNGGSDIDSLYEANFSDEVKSRSSAAAIMSNDTVFIDKTDQTHCSWICLTDRRADRTMTETSQREVDADVDAEADKLSMQRVDESCNKSNGLSAEEANIFDCPQDVYSKAANNVASSRSHEGKYEIVDPEVQSTSSSSMMFPNPVHYETGLKTKHLKQEDPIFLKKAFPLISLPCEPRPVLSGFQGPVSHAALPPRSMVHLVPDPPLLPVLSFTQPTHHMPPAFSMPLPPPPPPPQTFYEWHRPQLLQKKASEQSASHVQHYFQNPSIPHQLPPSACPPPPPLNLFQPPLSRESSNFRPFASAHRQSFLHARNLDQMPGVPPLLMDRKRHFPVLESYDIHLPPFKKWR